MNALAVQEELVDSAALMQEYKATGSLDARNQLVMHYGYIARVVGTQMRGISSNYAQMEDIVNQGMLTLIDCVEKFDPDKGIKFESYAFMRVRGAIIDFVRKQDWLPRRVRLNSKNITAAHDVLCNELMREPTHQELADRLQMPVETLLKHYGEISNAVMLSFEGLIQNVSQMGDLLETCVDESGGPEHAIFQQEMRDTLKASIDALSERERLVVTLYYYEHLKLAEIAQVLHVSEQRVSQINAKAVMSLRNKMDKYLKG